MKLSFDQAVEEHRKMWRWIAENSHSKSILDMKQDYLNKFFDNQEVELECFCCEYDHNFNDNCSHCPLVWSGEYPCHCTESKSPYAKIHRAHSIYEFRELAYEIANLPTREKGEDDL